MAFDWSTAAEPVAAPSGGAGKFDWSTAVETPKPNRKEQILARLSRPERALAENAPTLFRAYRGARGTLDAGGQILDRLLPDEYEGAIKKAASAANPLVRGALLANTPEDRLARQEAASELDTDKGIDWYGVAGSVVDPIALATGTKAFQGMSGLVKNAPKVVKALAPSMAAGGAVSTLSVPTEEGLSGGEFVKEKAIQGGVGTLLGGIFGGATALLPMGKSVTPLAVKNARQNNPKEFTKIQNNVLFAIQEAGIDYSGLNKAARSQIDDYIKAATAGGVSPDDAAAVARKALLENLPVPIKSATKGQLTQDFQQKQLERIAADSVPTPAGRELRTAFETQPSKLVENIESITQRSGGIASGPADFGADFRKFITGQYSKAKQSTSAAYKAAEKETGNLPAQFTDNEIQWLTGNQGFPGVSALTQKAKSLGIVDFDEAGNLIPKKTTFRNLAQLRSAASNMTKGGGQEAHYGGEFKRVIDSIFDDYGSSLYKQASSKRREQGITFESGAKIISDLIKKKSGSEIDDAISDERIFNRAVINSSVDDIKKLTDFLSKRGGESQIKNIQAMTSDYLKGIATNQGRNPEKFADAAVWNAIKNMGGMEKLKAIYGPKGAKEFEDLMKASKILQDQGGFAAGGSQTASRAALLANNLFKFLDKYTYGLATKAKAASDASGAVAPSFGPNIRQPGKINAFAEGLKTPARNALVIGGNDD